MKITFLKSHSSRVKFGVLIFAYGIYSSSNGFNGFIFAPSPIPSGVFNLFIASIGILLIMSTMIKEPFTNH